MVKLLNEEGLIKLAKKVGLANRDITCSVQIGDKEFSAASLECGLREQLRLLCGYNERTKRCDVHEFNKNQELACQIMEIAIDSARDPRKVAQQYAAIAEMKTFGEEERPVFYIRQTLASKRRAMQYVKRGAKAGIYDSFELASDKIDGHVFTITASGRLSYEQFISGEFTLADIMDIINEGTQKRLQEILAALLGDTIRKMPQTNKKMANGFAKEMFDELLDKSDSYGAGNSTIYCCKSFARKMAAGVQSSGLQLSNNMKEELFKNGGWFGTYPGGSPIIIIEQSYTDETNTEKVMNEGYCFIIPNGIGSDAKPVKLGQMGKTHIRKRETTDWGIVIDSFQQYAVAIVVQNDIFAYIDCDLLTNSKGLALDKVDFGIA